MLQHKCEHVIMLVLMMDDLQVLSTLMGAGSVYLFVIFVGVWSKKAAEAALNRLREKILRVRHISPLCLCACEVLPLDEL